LTLTERVAVQTCWQRRFEKGVRMPQVERSFIVTPSGRIHIASTGSGAPVLLLHQTPRSWDEFRDVLPLLGRHYRVIAMDTVGYGDSDPLPDGKASIENWATAAHQLLVALGVGRAVVVGHHTGAAIAVEIAAAYPKHVAALVLSASPYVDEARRKEARETGHGIDHAVPRADGGHLADRWSKRQPFYPPDRIDLMERFIVDALKAGSRAVEGHRVVDRYEMETRLPLVRCPTLVIAPTADPHAHPHAPKVAAAIAGSALVEIEDGMVPLPDQKPAEFTEVIHRFLAAQPVWST
jgi:pimeloyl-ACP methyl ester carboxylesterase